jgi:hypothetical protein
MSNTARVTAWATAAAAVMGVLLAALSYGANRADSYTEIAVKHETRHVSTESDVESISETMREQNKVIQAQLSEGREMRIIILKKILEK